MCAVTDRFIDTGCGAFQETGADMNTDENSHQTFCAGTYSNITSADNAVTKLLAAGFTKYQINVACTNDTFSEHFPEYRQDHKAKSTSTGEVVTGAAIGATVGGLAAVSLGLAGGAVPLLIAGAAGISGGSTMGGFLGAMLSKPVENDFLNLYHDELERGKILVAVVDTGKDSAAKLATAAEIFNETGSELPVHA